MAAYKSQAADVMVSYTRVYETSAIYPGLGMSFWWRRNGPVTSQSTDLIKRAVYP